jgi:hypothetical protein
MIQLESTPWFICDKEDKIIAFMLIQILTITMLNLSLEISTLTLIVCQRRKEMKS